MPDDVFTWYAPKDLVVRTTGDPVAFVPAIRAIVHRADRDLPLSDIQTLEQLVAGETVWRVAQLRVLGAFAFVALLLGGVGIHGLLAFAVSARMPELGVRMALGARRADIVSMIMSRSLRLTVIGIAIGVVLAYLAGRATQSLLVGIAPGDGLAFAVAIAVTLAMAVAGSLRPALRAARVDPVTVIRL
jgi:ABC-type antimicrobial peptide transport system permease subunit